MDEPARALDGATIKERAGVSQTVSDTGISARMDDVAGELLAVSAAARMLGVSSSSLRAWAAAGRVPHVRTAGGHRRFARRELERWLRERGGEPPATPTRTGELVPTRSEPLPELAAALAARIGDVLAILEEEVARVAGRRGRGGAQRRARARDAVESLVEGLEQGDLGAPVPRGRVGGLPAWRERRPRRRPGHRGARAPARGRAVHARPPGRAARRAPGARAGARPDGDQGRGGLRRRRAIAGACPWRLSEAMSRASGGGAATDPGCRSPTRRARSG